MTFAMPLVPVWLCSCCPGPSGKDKGPCHPFVVSVLWSLATQCQVSATPSLLVPGAPRSSQGTRLPLANHEEAHGVSSGQANHSLRTLDTLGGIFDTQGLREALTAPGGGWETGRRRGKYIFKDNLQANIIFILIYPQSSRARPQTCLMSRNCKMAMGPPCLPLPRLLAVTRTHIFQLCNRCRQNGCKEHQSL